MRKCFCYFKNVLARIRQRACRKKAQLYLDRHVLNELKVIRQSMADLREQMNEALSKPPTPADQGQKGTDDI